MASAHPLTNGSYGGVQDLYSAPSSHYTTENGTSAEKSGGSVNKDEVGWYFVERYYTTLSDKPDQLHLFYNKKSQFVYGKENEVLPVLVGRNAIQERISNLDFQGSKVRVANVDSQQADGECIVIQVIGEIFNSKSNELNKFVQTFVLAKQHNGYFVLNDMFRSLKDTEEEQEVPAVEEAAPVAEEEEEEEVVAEVVEEPKVEEQVEEPKLDADVVDEKLESALASEPAVEAPTTNGNGVTAEVDEAEEAPVAATKPEPVPEVAEKEVEEEAAKEIEKPKEPSPTPTARIATPPKTKPAVPIQPAAPPKPMTWASRAAAAAASSAPAKTIPVVPVKTATPPVQPRAAPPSAPAAPATQTSQKAAAAPVEPSAEKESDPAQSQGWQTAGSDQKRQARPQSVSSPVEKDGTLGYVRNVTDKVNAEELKAVLTKHGDLVYFDVNRQKNCAFIEFANTAGYQAAVAANPHVLGGENIIVEPRRPKAAAYGGAGYNNNNRGGAMNGRGRGGFDQGRPGNQGGGRGGFIQRGRGGAPGSGPRGGAAAQRPAGQTTTA